MAQAESPENRQHPIFAAPSCATAIVRYHALMGQLLVRDVPDEIVGALKTRAKKNGRSAEAEHRLILESALKPSRKAFWNRAERSRARTAKIDFGDSTALLREDRDSR
jgi:antitoxin FitA